MKKILSLALLCLAFVAAFSQLSCDASLWPHVYKPERLQGEKKCITVKGIVKSVNQTDDGNYRLQLKLDPGQPISLLNDKNMALQNGCLVLEIICGHRPIKDPDALKSCGVFESKIRVPLVGAHIQAIGTSVLDSEHGWNALYPLSDVQELQKR
jgi:hypothetical protein